MNSVCKENKCNGCMLCADICPKGAITVKDNLVSYNARIDNTKCNECGLCKRMCPNNYSPVKINPINWNQGWTYDDIGNNSSSGGVATSIILSFIKGGGYVASCMFKEGEFLFEITNDNECARRFAGSKYVKSNPTGIYREIKQKLNEGHKVLFIGLPCQVAAVKNYVGNNINLYVIDLICHGTPSRKILDKFLNENGYKLDEIENIKFRNKNHFGLIIDKYKITPDVVMDDYMISFLHAASYTENCYSCAYATTARISDITLGDSWGTELVREEEKGVSLVICQTEKGKELLSMANLKLMKVNVQNAIRNNKQLTQPSIMRLKRKVFMKNIQSGKTFKKSILLAAPKTVIKQRIKFILAKNKGCQEHEKSIKNIKKI